MELKLTSQNGEEKSIKWFSRLNFIDSNLCDGIHMKNKKEIVNDKLFYVGTLIWDLSKLATMKFHNEVIHKTHSKDNTT